VQSTLRTPDPPSSPHCLPELRRQASLFHSHNCYSVKHRERPAQVALRLPVSAQSLMRAALANPVARAASDALTVVARRVCLVPPPVRAAANDHKSGVNPLVTTHWLMVTTAKAPRPPGDRTVTRPDGHDRKRDATAKPELVEYGPSYDAPCRKP
jgi:hypothetical protein